MNVCAKAYGFFPQRIVVFAKKLLPQTTPVVVITRFMINGTSIVALRLLKKLLIISLNIPWQVQIIGKIVFPHSGLLEKKRILKDAHKLLLTEKT